VSEKDIEDLFAIEEEEIGTLSSKEKAPLEVAKQKVDMEEQAGNTGGGKGAPTDEKLPSPYLAATSPSLHSAALDPIHTDVQAAAACCDAKNTSSRSCVLC
jgi:hypothetical protein